MAEKLSCTFFRAAYRLGGGFEFSACHRPPRRQTLGKFGGAGGAVRSRGSAWTAAACRRCVDGTVPGLPTLRPGGNCLRWPETPTPFHASGRQEKLSRSRGVERGPARVYAVELSQNAVVRGASSLGLDDFLAQRAPVPAVSAHPLRHGVQKLKCAAASLICHNRKSPRLGSWRRPQRRGASAPRPAHRNAKTSTRSPVQARLEGPLHSRRPRTPGNPRGTDCLEQEPEQGPNHSAQPRVRSVAESSVGRVFAAAPGDRAFGLDFDPHRAQPCALVRSVAERLFLGLPARAPPIGSGLDLLHERLPCRYSWQSHISERWKDGLRWGWKDWGQICARPRSMRSGPDRSKSRCPEGHKKCSKTCP